MNRFDFLKKLSIIGLGANFLLYTSSCSKDDENYNLSESEGEKIMDQIHKDIILHKVIYISEKSQNIIHSRKQNHGLIDVQLSESTGKTISRNYKEIINASYYIIGVLCLKNQKLIENLSKKGFNSMVEIISDEIIYLKYTIPKPIFSRIYDIPQISKTTFNKINVFN